MVSFPVELWAKITTHLSDIWIQEDFELFQKDATNLPLRNINLVNLATVSRTLHTTSMWELYGHVCIEWSFTRFSRFQAFLEVQPHVIPLIRSFSARYITLTTQWKREERKLFQISGETIEETRARIQYQPTVEMSVGTALSHSKETPWVYSSSGAIENLFLLLCRLNNLSALHLTDFGSHINDYILRNRFESDIQKSVVDSLCKLKVLRTWLTSFPSLGSLLEHTPHLQVLQAECLSPVSSPNTPSNYPKEPFNLPDLIHFSTGHFQSSFGSWSAGGNLLSYIPNHVKFLSLGPFVDSSSRYPFNTSLFERLPQNVQELVLTKPLAYNTFEDLRIENAAHLEYLYITLVDWQDLQIILHKVLNPACHIKTLDVDIRSNTEEEETTLSVWLGAIGKAFRMAIDRWGPDTCTSKLLRIHAGPLKPHECSDFVCKTFCSRVVFV